MKFSLQLADLTIMPATAVSVNAVCPAFDGDSISRAVSLPFVLPLSAEVKASQDHLQRIDNNRYPEGMPATLCLGGIPLVDGEYRIHKATDTALDGNFQNVERVILDTIEQKKIRDLLPDLVVQQLLTGLWEFAVVAPSQVNQSYYLVVNEVQFQYFSIAGDTAQTICTKMINLINATLPNFAYYRNNYGPDTAFQIRSTGASVRLRPWLPYMEGFTFNATNYRTYAQARQTNFLNYFTAAVDVPLAECSFGFLFNKDFYEGKNLAWNYYINFAEKINGTWSVGQNSSFAEDARWEYAYTPFVRVSYLLQKIADFMGLAGVNGDFTEWADLHREAIIYNCVSLDEVVKEWQFNLTAKTETEKHTNVHKTSISLAERVPDFTIREFLRKFCGCCNLWWEIKNEQLFFHKKQNMLRAIPQDWSGKINPTTIERGYTKYQGLKLTYEGDDKDPANAAIAPILQGAAIFELKIPTGTLPENAYHTGKWMHYSEQPHGKDFAFRLMLDRGLQHETPQVQYIQLSNRHKNGTAINSVSLLLQDLWTWTWAESATLAAYGVPITAYFHLTMGEITEILLWQNAMRHFVTPRGTTTGAIKNVTISEGLVKVELVI